MRIYNTGGYSLETKIETYPFLHEDSNPDLTPPIGIMYLTESPLSSKRKQGLKIPVQIWDNRLLSCTQNNKNCYWQFLFFTDLIESNPVKKVMFLPVLYHESRILIFIFTCLYLLHNCEPQDTNNLLALSLVFLLWTTTVFFLTSYTVTLSTAFYGC